MSIEILFLYYLLGLAIHIILYRWTRSKKHLRWPDGVITAGLISSFLYIVNFFFWLLLALFFASSSLLTRYREKDKESLQTIFDKGGERDGYQVLANSFGLVIAAVFELFTNGIQLEISPILVVGATIFIAVVTADTWATEIGTLSNKQPRLILMPWKPVPRGTSGGVTLIGFFAAFLGSSFISTIMGLYVWTQIFYFNSSSSLELNILTLVLFVAIFGFFGQTLDSILGETVQAMYHCPECLKTVESAYHVSCGVKTNFKSGFQFFSNDLVNVSAGLISVIFGIIMFPVVS